MQAMDAAMKLVETGVITVTPEGEVWKCRILNGRVLKEPRRLETLSKRGYHLVRPYWNGKRYLVWAHRLVWTVLRGPIPDGMDINHKDGDKLNNHPENLELATRRENIRHSIRTGLAPQRGFSTERRAELRRRAVPLRERGMTYRQIGERIGVSQTTAFRVVQGQ